MLESRSPTPPGERPVRGAPLLELSAVAKRWGPRTVLDGVDLVLATGRSVRIRGANGAGKTTLLRIAAGLVVPDAGAVSLDGHDPERHRGVFLRRLSFCSAGDRGLYARLSTRRHLRLCARLALMEPREAEAAVDSTLTAFALADFADRRVERTSMGQRQRTRLAMAFVHSPDVVLLDEPANSLDDEGLAVLADAIERMRAKGGAVLCAVPSTAEAPLPFDDRLVLSAGALVSE